jgi:hypothetical protein
METNFKQLQQIRDDVHKNIIRTVINAGINIDGKYRVLVNDPVPFQLTRVGRDSELICIAGVDGNTCELIDDSEKCIYLRYQDVPIEQLKQLEDQLEKNRFKIFN